MKIRQIQRCDEDFEKIALYLQRQRMMKKNNFDVFKILRLTDLFFEYLILLHDIKLNNQHIDKFNFRWLRPYKLI